MKWSNEKLCIEILGHYLDGKNIGKDTPRQKYFNLRRI